MTPTSSHSFAMRENPLPVAHPADLTDMVRRAGAVLRELWDPSGESGSSRQLVELIGEMAVVIDARHGRILEANSAAASTLGFSRHELLSMSGRELAGSIHPSHRDRLVDAVERANGDPDAILSLDFHLLDGRNSWRHLQARCTALTRDHRGQWAAILGVAREHDKPAAHELTTPDPDVVRGLAEATCTPWTVVRSDGRVDHHNRAACDLLGISPGEVSPVDISRLVHPADVNQLNDAHRVALQGRGGGPAETSVRIGSSDGRWREVTLRAHQVPQSSLVVLEWCGPPGAEDPLEALAQQAVAVGMWGLDLEQRRFRACGQYAALLGLDEDELGDEPSAWLGRVHSDDQEGLELELLTVTEGLSPRLDAEFRMRRGDGTYAWMRARAEAEPDDEGRVRRLGGTLECIDSERRLEQVVHRSERRFRTLIEHLPQGIAVHRSGRVVFANQGMAEQLGWDRPEDLVGRAVLELFHVDERAAVARQVRALTRHPSRPVSPHQTRLACRDGRTLVAEVASLPINFEDQPAILSVAQDVHDRTAIQAQLVQASRLASLGSLTAGVAHEINNPLTYITLALEGLLEQVPKLRTQVEELRTQLQSRLTADELDSLPEPDAYRTLFSCTRDAYEGANRVRTIVRDLGLFCRPDDDATRLVSVHEVLDTALNLCSHELKRHAVVQKRYTDVPSVLAREGHLCHVFLELVLNAVQSKDQADEQLNLVRVSTRQRGEHVVVSIQDSGQGIDPAHVDRVFDPFFTTRPPGHGAGLGLAMCRQIVESLDGRIEVQSKPGHGSEFRVVLPVPMTNGRGRRRPPAQETPSMVDLPLNRTRMLLVDEDEKARRRLGASLAREYDVVHASSAREAIELLLGDPGYELILTELAHSGAPGIPLFAWVRDNSPELLERMVFAIGGALAEPAQRFLDGVPNRCVDKPIDAESLFHVLRQVLDPPTPPPPVRREHSPTPPRLHERRAGPRYPAEHIQGVMDTLEESREVDLVDYSVSGIRAHVDGTDQGVSSRATPVSLTLRNEQAKGYVTAEIALVRTENTGAGVDYCFQIRHMDPNSTQIYASWLAAEA